MLSKESRLSLSIAKDERSTNSDSVKRLLRGRHLSVLNLKFDFISDGGCTREEQIALSLKRHLFPHGGREPKAFWICFSRVHPPPEIKSNFKFKALKRHLLKRHLTLSENCLPRPGSRQKSLARGGGGQKRILGVSILICKSLSLSFLQNGLHGMSLFRTLLIGNVI